ncbi:unnamed protein product [Penicillium salamii]|uniref:N-acetyl-D-glucosamine kinase n=1 Tax=Penicillium salamii TaxID=1612424 RepID=A0A9W4JKL5_9EURO|nr:unnamed protein product [Penicillium salamii]
MDLDNLANLQTEGVNPETVHIDQVSTLEMCTLINSNDQQVPHSVVPCLPEIAAAIDALAPRVSQGGRVIYVGAGTSGRLGILDASEIPPTFAAPRGQFLGLIAGGDAAIRQAQEGAEDDGLAGEEDMRRLDLNPELDSIIGIASSGRTPYVLGCLAFTKRLGCMTIGVVCTSPSAIDLSGDADFVIAPLPGPEVVTGSTRLKAGTVTKLVLNMLSTGTMIKAGKTYGNMMVDMVASNLKLKKRSHNMLRRVSAKCKPLSDGELDSLLVKCNHSVKLAVLVAESQYPVDVCERHLEFASGVLAKALADINRLKERTITETSPLRPFVLCVDGGGTKCAAVVTDGTGAVYRGSAGPCNLTDRGGGIFGVMATILEAVKSALKDVSTDCGKAGPWQKSLQTCFSSVWVGIAGLDRTGFQGQLARKLADAFGIDDPWNLRLTNDVDLLTAAVPLSHPGSSVLVVIAGTGSVAMRYRWDADQKKYQRVARSGGWGHILGDEGGGYAIGLKAIQHTLGVFENAALGLVKPDSDKLAMAVSAKLGFNVCSGAGMDLLNDLLAQSCAQIAKRRIAGVAEVVLNLTSECMVAAGIVRSQSDKLISDTLSRLVNPGAFEYHASENSVLILAGGLLNNDWYRAGFKDQLDYRQLFFSETVVVENAAAVGAEYLSRLA